MTTEIPLVSMPASYTLWTSLTLFQRVLQLAVRDMLAVVSSGPSEPFTEIGLGMAIDELEGHAAACNAVRLSMFSKR